MRLRVLLLVTAAVLALDLWTKRWATTNLAGQPPVELLGEFVRFTYTRNSGVAFGIGAGIPFPYYLFSIAAALAIVWLFVRQRVQHPVRRLALALILGGALGNLVDRVTTGEVVDFIEVGWDRWRWPVFNVADSAVTVGVVLFALTWPRREPAAEAGGGAPEGGGGRAGHEPPAAAADPSEEAHAGSRPDGPGAAAGGAARPLPRGGADRPLA